MTQGPVVMTGQHAIFDRPRATSGGRQLRSCEERTESGKIHVISLRRANRREVRRYEAET